MIIATRKLKNEAYKTQSLNQKIKIFYQNRQQKKIRIKLVNVIACESKDKTQITKQRSQKSKITALKLSLHNVSSTKSKMRKVIESIIKEIELVKRDNKQLMILNKRYQPHVIIKKCRMKSEQRH